MMSPGLIDRIIHRAATAVEMTPGEFREFRLKRIRALEARLQQQLERQRMTPEVLNKRCTL